MINYGAVRKSDGFSPGNRAGLEDIPVEGLIVLRGNYTQRPTENERL